MPTCSSDSLESISLQHTGGDGSSWNESRYWRKRIEFSISTSIKLLFVLVAQPPSIDTHWNGSLLPSLFSFLHLLASTATATPPLCQLLLPPPPPSASFYCHPNQSASFYSYPPSPDPFSAGRGLSRQQGKWGKGERSTSASSRQVSCNACTCFSWQRVTF